MYKSAWLTVPSRNFASRAICCSRRRRRRRDIEDLDPTTKQTSRTNHEQREQSGWHRYCSSCSFGAFMKCSLFTATAAMNRGRTSCYLPAREWSFNNDRAVDRAIHSDQSRASRTYVNTNAESSCRKLLARFVVTSNLKNVLTISEPS